MSLSPLKRSPLRFLIGLPHWPSSPSLLTHLPNICPFFSQDVDEGDLNDSIATAAVTAKEVRHPFLCLSVLQDVNWCPLFLLKMKFFERKFSSEYILSGKKWHRIDIKKIPP